jgi:Beta-lactamase enzyme family
MRFAVMLAAALVAAGTADARELRTPRPYEAFFGVVRAVAPTGTTTAELYVGDSRVSWRRLDGPRASFVVPRAPGRYDLRLRFERRGRLLRRDESQRVWLLPRSARVATRERRHDRALERRLGELGRAYRGYAGFWIHDLRTGTVAGWNSDTSFPAASILKLGVIVAALQRWEPGSAAWRDIVDTATWSSNEGSNRLLVRLGGSEAGGTRIVNETLRRIGATASVFTGNYRIGTGALGDTPRPLPVLTYRRTTARDVGRILFEVHAAALGNGLALRRTGLDRHEARMALGLLLSSDPRGDNAGLFRHATGVPMAAKHGWTTKLRHTAAILYGPDGPKIAVLLTFRPDEIRPSASRVLGGHVIGLLGL